MKRFLALLSIVFTSVIAYAQNNQGAISITSLNTQNVRIEIDNKNYTFRDHSATIRNLSPGYHAIKVYLQNEISNSSYASYNYKRQLLYSANIRVKSQYHVDIVINRFGRALVDERFMDAAYMKEFCSEYEYANDKDNYNNYNNRNDDYNRRNTDYRDKDNYSYNRPMSDQSFASFVQTMKREKFEDTRLQLMKQTIETSYFTTAQVKQLLPLLSFDDSKLEIAKSAYRNTVDKENYFQVYDAFTFSKSKEDLSNYIRDFK